MNRNANSRECDDDDDDDDGGEKISFKEFIGRTHSF